jgi:polysaccharide export outer membrane protein
MVKDLAAELKEVEGVGRITVQSDPTVLKAHPDEDILLEPNDRIYIPRRPMTVRVYGEVLSPANLQFRKDKTPDNYVDEAGGMTYYADDDRAFVLYPDGSAQPLQISSWNHKATMIPPGSTIVVPRDPKPFDFIESAKDITQILSNLAITSVFVHDIKDN